jgi:hypothetical protein
LEVRSALRGYATGGGRARGVGHLAYVRRRGCQVSKNEELREARAAAEGQLEALRSRLSRLKDIERSRDTILSHYASLVPQGLIGLSPEQRNRVYRMMHLRVLAHRDDTLIADWGCNGGPLPPGGYRTLGR